MIWRPASAFYIDTQNAAALLWRVELQGVNVGDRWHVLAEVCAAPIDDHVLACTDLHAERWAWASALLAERLAVRG